MNYLLHICIMITLYVVLGLSLNLALGYAGLLAICHGAFYGVSAYVCTLLMMEAGWTFLPATGAAIVTNAALALAVGLPSLRLRGHYFVLATMGFQMIIFAVLYNWVDLTRGPYGIPGIPKPCILGWRVGTLPSFLALSTAMAAVVVFLSWQFARSPFGRVLRAIRDDVPAAIALGKNPLYFQIAAFVISGAMAAVAGSLYATYVTYVEPTCFGITEAIFILCVVVIGGTGNLKGPIVGAVFVVLLPEALRFVQVPDTVAPNVRQIIYGVLLILAMRFRPQGMVGCYAYD